MLRATKEECLVKCHSQGRFNCKKVAKCRTQNSYITHWTGYPGPDGKKCMIYSQNTETGFPVYLFFDPKFLEYFFTIINIVNKNNN